MGTWVVSQLGCMNNDAMDILYILSSIYTKGFLLVCAYEGNGSSVEWVQPGDGAEQPYHLWLYVPDTQAFLIFLVPLPLTPLSSLLLQYFFNFHTSKN